MTILHDLPRENQHSAALARLRQRLLALEAERDELRAEVARERAMVMRIGDRLLLVAQHLGKLAERRGK